MPVFEGTYFLTNFIIQAIEIAIYFVKIVIPGQTWLIRISFYFFKNQMALDPIFMQEIKNGVNRHVTESFFDMLHTNEGFLSL